MRFSDFRFLFFVMMALCLAAASLIVLPITSAHSEPDWKTDPEGYKAWCRSLGRRFYLDSFNLPHCDPGQQYIYRSAAEMAAVERGNQAMHNSEFDAAIAAYQEAQRLCNNQAQFDCSMYQKGINEAYVLRERDKGNYYWDTKNWDAAISTYQNAINLCKETTLDCSGYNETIARAKVYRERDKGNDYLDAENWDAAIGAYDYAVTLCNATTMDCNPFYKQSLLPRWNKASSRAADYYNAHDYKSAIPYYQDALDYCTRMGRDCTRLRDLIKSSYYYDNFGKAKNYILDQNWNAAYQAIGDAKRYCTSDCAFLDEMIPNARKNQIFEEGQTRWKAKDWVGALTKYKTALAYCLPSMDCGYIRYDIALANVNIAEDAAYANLQSKEWDKAVDGYKKALSFCTPDMDCNWLKKNLEIARKHFDNWDVEKGHDALKAGNPSQALDKYKKALEKNETSKTWMDMGYALSKLGRKQEALAAYGRAFELDPTNPLAARNIQAVTTPETLDFAISVLEDSILVKAPTTDPDLYQSIQEILDEMKAERLSFGHDLTMFMDTVSEFIAGLFGSGDDTNSTIPNVAMDQLIQARDHGKKAEIAANQINEEWMLTVKPEDAETALETAHFQATMVFDRGKEYNPNTILFGSDIPAPEGQPINSSDSPPRFDVSQVPDAVKATPEWGVFMQQASLLGQDYMKKDRLLQDLQKQAESLSPDSPDKPKLDETIQQAKGDLENTREKMKDVEDDLQNFWINFDEAKK